MNYAGTKNTVERRGRYSLIGPAAIVILLLSSGVCLAQIQNPSFEDRYYLTGTYTGSRWMPSRWLRTDQTRAWNKDNLSFGSRSMNTWQTDGFWSVGIYGAANKVQTPGNYQCFYQVMDLEGIAAIEFDVKMFAAPSGPFDHFEVSLVVDDTPVWNQNAGGDYVGQRANVSKLQGKNRRIELRITALDGGSYPVANWCQWDNFKLIEGAKAIDAIVELDPGTLNLGSNGQWITAYIGLEAGYDVAAINGETVTLNEIPAHMGGEGWATPGSNEGNLLDRDGDGVFERRMVKFDRAAVQALVQPPEATLTLKGSLFDGTEFQGSATIQVVEKGNKK